MGLTFWGPISMIQQIIWHHRVQTLQEDFRWSNVQTTEITPAFRSMCGAHAEGLCVINTELLDP